MFFTLSRLNSSTPLSVHFGWNYKNINRFYSRALEPNLATDKYWIGESIDYKQKGDKNQLRRLGIYIWTTFTARWFCYYPSTQSKCISSKDIWDVSGIFEFSIKYKNRLVTMLILMTLLTLIKNSWIGTFPFGLLYFNFLYMYNLYTFLMWYNTFF